MDKRGKSTRHLKIAIVTTVAVLLIIGCVFAMIRVNDRMELDIQKLRTAIAIADAMKVRISFGEGYIVMARPGISQEKKTDIPTLKDATFSEKSVLVVFRSLFFRKTIDLKKSPALGGI